MNYSRGIDEKTFSWMESVVLFFISLSRGCLFKQYECYSSWLTSWKLTHKRI